MFIVNSKILRETQKKGLINSVWDVWRMLARCCGMRPWPRRRNKSDTTAPDGKGITDISGGETSMENA